MDEYLKGFVDGYNKAKGSTEIVLDGEKVAKQTYEEIKNLEAKEKSRRNRFNA